MPKESKKDLVREYALDRSTWTYKGFHGVLHTFFPVGRGPVIMDFFEYTCNITVFFIKDNYVHWYWNDDDLTRIREKFMERLGANKDYLKELKKEWDERVASFDEIIREIDGSDLRNFSNEDLASLYDDFYKRYVDQFRYFMALGDAVSMHADRYLAPEFQKILGKDFIVIFPKLLATKYLSFIEEENIEREKLLEIFREKGVIPRKTLEAHAREFFYIHNNYAKGIRLIAEDFNKMIREDL